MAKILIVDDNVELCDVMGKYLKSFLHEVDIAQDGSTAEAFLRTYDYDVLILDLNLPDSTGFEICKKLRQRGSKILIWVVTGNELIDHKMQLLDIGADDYLTKPFDFRELKSRIQALLRRKPFFQQDTIAVGNLFIDTPRHRVELNGQPVELGRREYQLLEFFARYPNMVLAPEFIFQHVWATDSDVNLDAVRTSVKRLRRKIDPEGKIIETMYGAGYVFRI